MSAPMSIMPSMPMFMMPACSVMEPPMAASATGVALRSICVKVPAENTWDSISFICRTLL